jgi:predicted HicB family RNase H-like nuclease
MTEESKLHMRVPRALREALEVEAKADDRTLNSYIIHIIKSRKAGKSHPEALAKIAEVR